VEYYYLPVKRNCHAIKKKKHKTWRKCKRHTAKWKKQICNPDYSGGRDQEDYSLKPAQENRSWDVISKKSFTQKSWWSGSSGNSCLTSMRPTVQNLVLQEKKKKKQIWSYCTLIQLYGIMEKAELETLKWSMVARGLGWEQRKINQGSRETILYDTITANVCHCTFVKTHRRYNLKRES
jgi:hypothetical protein